MMGTASARQKRPPASLVSSADSMEAKIGALTGFTLEQLRHRWHGETGKTAPEHLPKYMLARILAYRIQAEMHGDLNRQDERFLTRIANLAAQKKAGSFQGSVVPPVPPPGLRPGTVLIREHKGLMHRVTILEEGFGWNGAVHESLSAIARSITGTSWNGPRFFGLRSKLSEKGSDGRVV